MGLIERRLPMRFSKIPGEDPSQIAFSPKIGNLHRDIIGKLPGVTICRELKHSDQIITSEHVGTDRRWKNRCPRAFGQSRFSDARYPPSAWSCTQEQKECVLMPAKMSRSAPRPPFRLREVSIAVRTLRLSCGKAGKAPYSRRFGSHPGESRLRYDHQL